MHPNCECENAKSPRNSPGPVKNDETLRLFLTSTYDIDGKRASQRIKRPFKALSLKNAFRKNGLSTYRLRHATKVELERAAGILYSYQFGRSPEFGGVLGVVDFPVGAVRRWADPSPSMCVYETPLKPNECGGFDLPSHSDVVVSRGELLEEDRKASLDILYNTIRTLGMQQKAEDVEDCDLRQFLSAAVIEDGR